MKFFNVKHSKKSNKEVEVKNLKKTLVKKDIIEMLIEKHPEVSQAELKRIYNDIFESIKNTLMIPDSSVNINKLGTLKNVVQKERLARNPLTGEKIVVPESRRVRFKCSSVFKKELND